MKPRVAVVGCAFGGYNLGEELAPDKLLEAIERLHNLELDIVPHKKILYTEADCLKAGHEIAQQKDIDLILVFITTFIPDHFVVALTEESKAPTFLWAIEREMHCIALVCGLLITATLHDLQRDYKLVAADVGAEHQENELLAYARGCMLANQLKTARIGYVGGKNNIMFNMTADDFALKRHMGITVETIPVESYYQMFDFVDEKDTQAILNDLTKKVGEVHFREPDGVESIKHYIAMKKLCNQHNLDALSLNCFPNLKSKVCLGRALLNDEGIAAGCEGDLHSTLLMLLVHKALGVPAVHGDFLRLYPEENKIMFSHCGSAAFSLAGCMKNVILQPSIETLDGVAVKFAVKPPEFVTMLNLIGTGSSLRMTLLGGEGVESDLIYPATPLTVKFSKNVQDIVEEVSQCGAGHHWVGAMGDITREITQFCKLTGVPLTIV